ncbi:MAG: hypothetical protein LBV80_07975 [Deltaproteobacteria bacterium]|nr:hypothetical protein [Deltaproteobacteria bacterium]
MIMLLGCSDTRTVTQIKTVKLTPPAVLLRETPEPVFSGEKTNGALLNHLRDWESALEEANATIRAIGKWVGNSVNESLER